MLEECKRYCDYLICALQVDPTVDRQHKNKPVQSVVERYTQLKAVRYVDEVVPYTTEKELEEIFKSYPIDVRIIGNDYIGKEFTAKEICRERGIDVIFNKRDHDFSSTELRKRIWNAEQEAEIRK
jgi:glycerol-3-phosphate cytidylyltransferase